MLEAEPVNYCGLKDFSMVTYFQKGLIFLLQRFVNDEMVEGAVWNDDIVTSIYTLFDVLEDVDGYRHAYLARRIEQLETANGLCHCGDINP